MIKPVIAAAVLLVLCTVHISSGSYQIGYGELFNALFTGQADDTAATVIFNIRLPRLLSAVIAGVSLSVSGVVMQSIFRNPLVSPDLLGVSSGASLGTAVAVLLGFNCRRGSDLADCRACPAGGTP